MTLVALTFAVGLSQSPNLEAQAVKVMKETVVETINTGLPPMTLERWLQQQLGPRVEISWELNDCGEATGSSADVGRDPPFCAEASAVMPDRRKVTLTFFAGTEKTGLSSGSPKIYHGSMARPHGDAQSFYDWRDLPRLLKPR